jgi:hypothetical protein
VEPPKPSRLVRAYTAGTRWQSRILTQVNAAANGFWLGLMDRESLDLVDELYYEGRTEYSADDYNLGGLRPWEDAAVREHFPDSGRVVVTGAGGGREVLWLLEQGFDAVGYEPNRRLVEAGLPLLEERGHHDRLHVVDRDVFPADAESCAALLVGWSSYMLIPGRDRRVAFLRGARSRLAEEAPILLSFYGRLASDGSYRTIARVANVVRGLRRLPPVEFGDALSPNYTHHFTRDEVASELEAGGFRLSAFETEPEPHAIGRAV